MLMRRIALWFREPNVSRENCRSKESKSRTVRVYIKASMRIDISINLPPGQASTNDVIYKMRSRNVVTAALSGRRVTCHRPANLCQSCYFAKHSVVWLSESRWPGGSRGTGGIDMSLSTHGYFSSPVKTDGRRSVARNVSAFRRTGRPPTNRRAA
jgi:hypothetical protein